MVSQMCSIIFSLILLLYFSEQVEAVWNHKSGSLSAGSYDMKPLEGGGKIFGIRFKASGGIDLIQGKGSTTLSGMTTSAVYTNTISQFTQLNLADADYYSHILVATFAGLFAYLLSPVDGSGNPKDAGVDEGRVHNSVFVELSEEGRICQVTLNNGLDGEEITITITVGRNKVMVKVQFGDQSLSYEYLIPADQLVTVKLNDDPPREEKGGSFYDDDDDEDDEGGCCCCCGRFGSVWSYVSGCCQKQASSSSDQSSQTSNYGATGQTRKMLIINLVEQSGLQIDPLRMGIGARVLNSLPGFTKGQTQPMLDPTQMNQAELSGF